MVVEGDAANGVGVLETGSSLVDSKDDSEASPAAVAEDAAPRSGGSTTTDASARSLDEPVQNPSDFLTAALDGEISDAELENGNNSRDSMVLEQARSTHGRDTPLITVEEAQAKLPKEVLQILASKFKGSLTQVRHRDERDQIF